MGLLNKAKQMRDEGMSEQGIADYFNKDKENPNDKVSVMAVHRALGVVEKNKINNLILQGKNPLDELIKDIREKAGKLDKKLEELEKKANKILDDAMESDSVSDKTKALKEVRDTIVQAQKNQIIIHQYCESLQNSVNDESLNQKEQVTNILNIWTDAVTELVCPICRKEVIPEVIRLVGLEKEGKEKWQMEQTSQ